MSITTSREERDQAVEKVAAETDDQLRHDLAYWAVAVADHEARYTDLTNQREGVADLFREAQAWVRVVTDELAKRAASCVPPAAGQRSTSAIHGQRSASTTSASRPSRSSKQPRPSGPAHSEEENAMHPIVAVYLVKVTVRAPDDTPFHEPTNDQVGEACVNGIVALFESEQVEANATSVERTDD